MSGYEVIARPERDQLGEGPFWDVAAQALWWADISGRGVRRLDPSSGAVTRWTTPSPCSGAIPTVDGDVLACLADGVWRLDLASGAVTPFAQPDGDADNRSNDYRVDPRGRLWLGTMFNNIGRANPPKVLPRTGGLFVIGADGGVTRLLEGIGIPNALAFRPDGGRIAFADTTRDVIWTYAVDLDGPTLSDRRVLLQGGPGHPDGAAMDADGCLWNARWGAGVVLRITPDGRVDRTVELPCVQPSCCAFGGADLKTLYVTSAREDLAGVAEDSLDGALFAVALDVAGLPSPRFGEGLG